MQLVGTFVYPLPFAILAYDAARHPEHVLSWLGGGGWPFLGLFVLLGMGPFTIWGPLYARHHKPGVKKWRALGYGLAYTIYIFLYYITCWQALFRLIRGRSTWAKTRRNAETHYGPISIQT